MVVMDRTFDLVSPLVHDYNYQSVVFDYLDIPEDGNLEKIIPKQKAEQK